MRLPHHRADRPVRRGWGRRATLLAGVLSAGLAAIEVPPAGASHPPRPWFSLAPSSASLAGSETGGDTFESPKAMALSHKAMGLPAWADVDAISNGEDFVDPIDPCPAYIDPVTKRQSSTIYSWSIDPSSLGATGGGIVDSLAPPCFAGGSPELAEASVDDAPADVFMQLFTSNVRLRVNFLFHDESELGLLGGNADDVDALDGVLSLGVTGGTAPDQDVYFSVDGPTAALLGVSPADVLVVPAGTTSWSVAWTAGQLGLQGGDDVDALCIDRSAIWPRILLSLGRSSPSLGAYSAADVFKVVPLLDPFPGTGIQVPFLTHQFLSLLPGDNLDGLDCDLGDPGDGHEPDGRIPVGLPGLDQPVVDVAVVSQPVGGAPLAPTAVKGDHRDRG